jgi:DNA-binding NarL/FixJ family response regulator
MAHILIIDDHGVYRGGFKLMIERRLAGARVLEAPDLVAALSHFHSEQHIDLVLVEISRLNNHSLRSLRDTFQPSLNTRFAVISASNTRAEVLNCLSAGFHGFMDKQQSDDDILAAINDLLSGRIYVPPWVADHNDDSPELPVSIDMQGPGPMAHLTPRQNEVLVLLSRGLSNKEIAQELNIAEGTTKIHTTALLRTLGAKNRTEAAFLAAALIGAAAASQSVRMPPGGTSQQTGRVVPLPSLAARNATPRKLTPGS